MNENSLQELSIIDSSEIQSINSVTQSFLHAVQYNDEQLEYQLFLSIMGDWHFYQYKISIYYIIMTLVAGLQLFSFVFLFLPPQFICPNIIQGHYQSAANYQICDEGQKACEYQIIIDQYDVQNVSMDFGLFCEKKIDRELILISYFLSGSLEIGFNIIILGISEILAVLSIERFIEIQNARKALSYNLLISGILLLCFNMTFNSQKCSEDFSLFCPEKILEILLIGTNRFTNIFAYSFLQREFKIEYNLEQQRVSTWKFLNHFGLLGILLPLILQLLKFNNQQYLSVIGVLQILVYFISKTKLL
ncbi:hypothetical protein PPERSA_00036 [Pseudocohnilembus persalinus]|uniref:Transmembrane protein n=1 Tax=Pseudocohnilembus persalinus TaxID=266149 RepID=A0A0V0Q8K3_PSEPJ|nr:hypothetical protein PPERSA_00036 [Pseudocohnilembus persalinus]|eukprot:KRW98544.1 hypothetical protein PPERSA_00036 [Pseudocohnilembus persalinus]